MFRFEGFHMFGIFMTAVPWERFPYSYSELNLRTREGEPIRTPVKPYHHGVIIGSLIFGFGWALTGACPGPLYAQIGSGFLVTVATLSAAILGTWSYATYKSIYQTNLVVTLNT